MVKMLRSFILVFGFLISLTVGDEPSKVIVLTESNFDEAISSHKYILVEFCKFIDMVNYIKD